MSNFSCLLLVCLIIGTSAAAPPSAPPPCMGRPVPSAIGQTQPAVALAQRVLGSSLASRFGFEPACVPTDSNWCTLLPCFTIRNGNASKHEPEIVIGGTSPVEMAKGLGYYLQTQLNISFTWNKTGGNTVKNISGSLPSVPAAGIKGPRNSFLSYYLNVVTVSYSAVSEEKKNARSRKDNTQDRIFCLELGVLINARQLFWKR